LFDIRFFKVSFSVRPAAFQAGGGARIRTTADVIATKLKKKTGNILFSALMS
jgi:hypothetical protein